MRSLYDDYSDEDKLYIRKRVAEFFEENKPRAGRYDLAAWEAEKAKIPLRLYPLWRIQMEMDNPTGESYWREQKHERDSKER